MSNDYSLPNKGRFYAKVVVALAWEQHKVKMKCESATRGARYLDLAFRPSDPAKLGAVLKLAEPVALQTRTPAIIAHRLPEDPGHITFQFQLASGYWRSYTRADVTGMGVGFGAGRGKDGKGRQVDYSFDIPHSLIGGTTGSGKSETVKSIMVGLAEAYTPDNLNLVIIDPKEDYSEFDRLAHLAMPIAHTTEEIDAALAWAGQETTQRIGQEPQRRLVVMVDEAENILTRDRAGRARLDQLASIAKMGRSLDVNLILSTQEPHKGLIKDIKGQLMNRWIGWVESAQVSYLLTGHADLECHKLTSEGDFMHMAGPGKWERLQVAMATRADYDRLPRAEIRQPEVVKEDTPAITNVPIPAEARGPGRPGTELDLHKAAFYLVFGIDDVTISQAAAALDLKRYAHYLHRDAAREIKAGIEYWLKVKKGETKP